jgi:hypothetical protein
MALSHQDLIWQGLSPSEYDSLDDESKAFVYERAIAYQRIKAIKLVLDILDEIKKDVGEGANEFIYAVLTGKSEEAIETTREVLSEYLKEGQKYSMKEFYARRYKGRILKLLDGKISQKQKLMHNPRVIEIAIILSDWENKTPEKIMRADMDIIKKIMDITDENREKGLSDREIALAAEELVQDEFHEAQFHLEALKEDHRAELLKRALRLKDGA